MWGRAAVDFVSGAGGDDGWREKQTGRGRAEDLPGGSGKL